MILTPNKLTLNLTIVGSIALGAYLFSNIDLKSENIAGQIFQPDNKNITA